MILRALEDSDPFLYREPTITEQVTVADFYSLALAGGMEITVWRPVLAYMPRFTFDCVGFALNTWQRFSYSLPMTSAQKLFDAYYYKMEQISDARMGDLVACYKKDKQQELDYVPYHLARLLQAGSTEQAMVVHKRGIHTVRIEPLQAALDTYANAAKTSLELVYYREKDQDERPDLQQLIRHSRQYLGRYFEAPAIRPRRCVIS